uniref:response regulator transcription factor n=1 Tax=Ningiella ruwaisensis TaxID=2364274 RepID=UPI0010A02EA3|nr:response regulator transcription factor [Ningiella ruwaisensis]
MQNTGVQKVDQTANTILLIDDDKALGDLLCDYLNQQGLNASAEQSPLKGLELLKSGGYDLLLLDVMMPQLDGFELLKQLRQFSAIPVIMLTAKGDDYDKILGLELGADDYLPKPFNHRELLARIKALTRRLDPSSGFIKQSKMELHDIVLDESTREVKVKGQTLALTGTEFLFLLHLMRSKGHLLSKEHLSQSVLSRRLMPFDRSLDMHMSNIRKKLSEAGVDNVIRTVRGSGYMMVANSH